MSALPAAGYLPERSSMGLLRTTLKAANACISLVVVVSLCLAGAYAAYALWDNNRIYTAAQDVQADMLKIKPALEKDGSASFEELMAINQDVSAWVTLDNTNIDYPVLQGKNNLTYINTDVYGNFALAGSIFLDSRNDKAYHDNFSLLYGHYMEGGRMFGDLDLYKDEQFFAANRTGTLTLPDRAYGLEIFSCLLIPASEDMIFDPEKWQGDIDGLLRFVEDNSLYLHKDVMGRLRYTAEPPQILGLSTCSSEFTDARTIILAIMVPHAPVE